MRPSRKRSSWALMPVIQFSRRSAKALFGGARLEMIRVTNPNRASRKTFARASAIPAAAGSFCAFLANARSTLFGRSCTNAAHSSKRA